MGIQKAENIQENETHQELKLVFNLILPTEFEKQGHELLDKIADLSKELDGYLVKAADKQKISEIAKLVEGKNELKKVSKDFSSTIISSIMIIKELNR